MDTKHFIWRGRSAPVCHLYPGFQVSVWIHGAGGHVATKSRSLIFLYFRIGDAKFREAIAERVARETECARRLTLISIRAAEGFADGFIFPLFERHAGRQDVR